MIFNRIGGLHSSMGDSKRAVELHERALVIAQKSKNTLLEAATHSSIGRLRFEAREWEEAHSNFHSALRLYQQLGDKKGQAGTLLNIGKLNLVTGEQLLQSAAALFKEIGDSEGERAALELIQPAAEEAPKAAAQKPA